jgi:DNA-binding CsgD family transcriptional regulator
LERGAETTPWFPWSCVSADDIARFAAVAGLRVHQIREIADELHISLSTVKAHLASLMTKLSARNRVELAMWAYETDRINS